MTLTAGRIQQLTVVREAPPNGFYLSSEPGGREVLLHYAEIIGNQPQPGNTVDVFVYHDSEDRIAATMRQPLLQLGELKRLQVADIHARFGCFLEMGLGRQLLLPISELPELREYRPMPGDEVFVTMGHDRAGRLVAKLAGEQELAPLVFDAPEGWYNQTVEGWVTKTLQIGSFVLIDGGVIGFGAYGFIPADERPKGLRLGERVQARVTFIREDGRVNLAMTPLKQIGRIEDAERILTFLKERPAGSMPYSDETPADIIKERFGISKSAFKRAIGKLMRERLVTQEGSWTYLAEQAPGSEADSPPDSPSGD